MPTLTAPSKFANVLKSFNAFVSSEIETGLSLAVYYQGGGSLHVSLSALPNEWLEVNLMEMSPQTPVMVTGTGRHGVVLEYLATLNLFVKTDAIHNGTVSLYTPMVITDQIKGLFRPPTGFIPIHDYDMGGTPFAGALQPVTIPSFNEIAIPTGLGMRQWNLSSTLRQINESTD